MPVKTPALFGDAWSNIWSEPAGRDCIGVSVTRGSQHINLFMHADDAIEFAKLLTEQANAVKSGTAG